MILTRPSWYDRQTTPYDKIQALTKYNFKPVCQLANYQNKGLFDLCYGVPPDDAPRNQTALVRCIFTLAPHRNTGVQTGILNVLESMSWISGCALIAVVHTFRLKPEPETPDQFCDLWARELGFAYHWRDRPENEQQRKRFADRRGWSNIDIHETISYHNRDWITPEMCFVHVPESGSDELKQWAKGRALIPSSIPV